jgi:long-chain acyl-CoA synthetase
MNLASWLDQTGRRVPEAPALLSGDRQVATYAAFRRRAANVAGWLRDRFGVRPGDRVALFMHNSCAYLECEFGIWWAGAVAVPINAKLHPKEALWIARNAEASLLLACAKNHAALAAENLGGLPAELIEDERMDGLLAGFAPIDAPISRGMDDLAWLFYTSGTTGRPKGVMLTNGNVVAASVSYTSDVDSVSQDDCALHAAPLSHADGLYSLIHVRHGARHSIPESRGFEPEEILRLAARLRNVSIFAAPTMVKRLVGHAVENGVSGDGIKTIVYGGGPMYLADIEEALKVFGQKFVQIYGQGETPCTITALGRREHEGSGPALRKRLASVGTPHSVVEVRITGEDGAVCPPDRSGEVEVRGLTVMKGYWRNEEATAQALAGGWLRTGDVGRMDANGYLTLTDRSKDVIISGGTNIYPREVEEVLLTHPLVAEVAVVGEPDPEWGENVAAFVVLKRDAADFAGELEAFCVDNMARFKRPKRYERLDALPKNNYGKVLKTELRLLLARRSAQ